MAAEGQLKAWQKFSIAYAKLPQHHEQPPETLLREAMDMRVVLWERLMGLKLSLK